MVTTHLAHLPGLHLVSLTGVMMLPSNLGICGRCSRPPASDIISRRTWASVNDQGDGGDFSQGKQTCWKEAGVVQTWVNAQGNTLRRTAAVAYLHGENTIMYCHQQHLSLVGRMHSIHTRAHCQSAESATQVTAV